MALAPANYPVVDTSTFAIEYAKVKVRPYVDLSTQADGINHAGWVDVGEFEYLKTNSNVTPKEAWSKSQAIATLILTVNTKYKCSVSFKAMQRTRLMRAWSMLASTIADNQAGGNGTYTCVAVPGETHYVGFANITGVTASLGGGGNVPANDFVVFDQAAGGVGFPANLDPAIAGQAITFSFAYPPRNSTMLVAGGAPTIDIEMIARGVSDVGQKGLLHLPRVRVTPKGDQDQISSNDDWSTYEFEGNALLTTVNGVNTSSTWKPLDA